MALSAKVCWTTLLGRAIVVPVPALHLLLLSVLGGKGAHNTWRWVRGGWFHVPG